MEIFIRAKHLKANIILRKKDRKKCFQNKKHHVLFFLIFSLTYFTIYNRRWILFYYWCQLKSSYKSFYVTIRSGYNQIIVNKTFLLTVENLWFSLFFSTQPILKSTKCWRMCSIQWDELYAPPSLHTPLWTEFIIFPSKPKIALPLVLGIQFFRFLKR